MLCVQCGSTVVTEADYDPAVHSQATSATTTASTTTTTTSADAADAAAAAEAEAARVQRVHARAAAAAAQQAEQDAAAATLRVDSTAAAAASVGGGGGAPTATAAHLTSEIARLKSQLQNDVAVNAQLQQELGQYFNAIEQQQPQPHAHAHTHAPSPLPQQATSASSSVSSSVNAAGCALQARLDECTAQLMHTRVADAASAKSVRDLAATITAIAQAIASLGPLL
jgi:hypothetical protein